MFYYMHGFRWPLMVFGGLLTLLFWAAVIALIVLAVRALLRSGTGRGMVSSSASADGSTGRPLAILKERYARGEITKEQYENMRHDLEA